MERNIHRGKGDIKTMNFNCIDWADSNIERIIIEYDHAQLEIWNDTLQKKLIVHCTGLVGVTNLCIWDDTIISFANLKSVSDYSDDYLRSVFVAYDKNFDYGGRFLKDGLMELKINLVNDIMFSIYCQKVDVDNQSQDE
jgi:hypothetical protein